MLKIKCTQCGATLKGQDVQVLSFLNEENGVKYRDYTCTCSKCGGVVIHERIVKKALENKAKAIAKCGIIKTKPKENPRVKEQANKMTNESASLFVCGILRQAILDYQKPRQRKNVVEFFNSQWGKEVVEMFNFILGQQTENMPNITPKMILDSLESGSVDFEGLTPRTHGMGENEYVQDNL